MMMAGIEDDVDDNNDEDVDDSCDDGEYDETSLMKAYDDDGDVRMPTYCVPIHFPRARCAVWHRGREAW